MKLLRIIANAYQIAGAHDAPEHILDILSDPENATEEQVDAMLPYVAKVSIDIEKLARAMFECDKRAGFCNGLDRDEIYYHYVESAKAIIEELNK